MMQGRRVKLSEMQRSEMWDRPQTLAPMRAATGQQTFRLNRYRERYMLPECEFGSHEA